MPWGIVEAEDGDTGEFYKHILPVVLVEGFATREEAEAFVDRVEAAGSPCLTDDEDNITSTYFGHTLSKSCPCDPQPMRGDHGCLLHKAAN